MFRKRYALLVSLILISLAGSAQAAIVNGTFYEWSDFEKPLKNVLMEVEKNSTLISYKVSSDGTYSFDLSPGNYSIIGKYYRNSVLDLIGERKITITEADRFREFDILLFPPTDSENEYLGDINLTEDLELKTETDLSPYLVIISIVSLSFLIIYRIKKKTGLKAAPLPVEPEKIETAAKKELPEDLRNLHDMILKAGGRTTQKELRKKLACSEAKVSLMLDDLENRGLIKKIRKGRSNIIISENQQTGSQ